MFRGAAAAVEIFPMTEHQGECHITTWRYFKQKYVKMKTYNGDTEPTNQTFWI